MAGVKNVIFQHYKAEKAEVFPADIDKGYAIALIIYAWNTSAFD